MEPILVGYLMVAMLIIVLFLGMPIGLALMGVGTIGLLLTKGVGGLLFLSGTFPYSYTANFAYVVLPLFLLMGHMVLVTGVAERAFRAAQILVGRISGGLAMATIVSSAGFAMVSGSSVASVAMIGRIAIPEMLRRGYSQALTAGSVAAGGTLGVLIPPSGVLVIYSIATETSLVRLFTAALVPGFFTAFCYGLCIYLIARFGRKVAIPSHELDSSVPPTFSGKAREVMGGIWEVFLLFAVVMGGIYSGFMTAIESAAVGAFVATLLLLRARRGRRWRQFFDGLVESGQGTSSIFLLILGAGVFSLALGSTQLPATVANAAIGISDNQYLLIALLLIPYLLLGMLIDGISMLLLTLPIVLPIIRAAEIDPIWFGVVVTKTVEIGLLTPPVGLNAFVVKGVAPQLNLMEIFRGCFPFVICDIFIIIVLVIWPDIVYVLF